MLDTVMFMSGLWFYEVNVSENTFLSDAIIIKNSLSESFYIMANGLTSCRFSLVSKSLKQGI